MAGIPEDVLLDAFKLPAKGAITFLKKKGLKPSWRFEEVWKEEHVHAFTVAKMTKLDMLQDMLDELVKAQEEGIPFAEFQNTVEPRLKAQGWWGRVPDPEDPTRTVQLGSQRRLETIFNTNIRQSYSHGKWQKFQAVKKMRPFVRYSSLVHGNRRPTHRRLHNKVFRIDDPALKVIAPKNGFGCACDLVSMSQAELDRRGFKVEPPSEGVEREVLISKETGELRKVKGVKFKNGESFYPDAGFDYNPGEKDFTPSLKKYDKDLVKAFKKGKKK